MENIQKYEKAFPLKNDFIGLQMVFIIRLRKQLQLQEKGISAVF